ncbi:MAG TPA: TonB-dependent receptor [Ohtaekwangia sp.]|uniref:SusC/RagA family TonB-linked outer membrane protein n=1 Tax=Ohtaekwangia sp. TaxID=2066019 RepID=UPI002F94424F
MKNTLQYILIIVMLAAVPGTLLANPLADVGQQTTKVSGQVVASGSDGVKEVLPGVNILVKGTTVGTVTDADGRYSLELPTSDAVLVFSFIGYVTEEIPVGGQSTIDINMTPDVATLSEVVVVGAVLKRSDLTGSVAAIESEKLKELPTTSVTQALNGRLAGVYIQNSPGVSGGATIRVRGNNSIQFGNGPIFVVDGLIMDGGLNLINPNDIETIDVLKDASATAIYGARGANGVVIVTTKKGKKGPGRVTYDGWYGVQQFTKTMPRLGAKDIFDLRVDAYANTYMDANPTANRDAYINNVLLNPNSPNTPFAPYEFDTYNSGKSYNWLDAVTRNGIQQNHTVSFSKGNDDGAYYVSFNYTKNKGLMENSDYNRITGKINLEQNVKSWLKIGTNTTYTRSHESYVQGDIFGIANGANPLLPIDDTTKYLKWANNQNIDAYNPVRSLRIDGDGYQTRLMTSNYISAKVTSKLTLRTTISFDIMDKKDLWYTPHDLGQSIRNSTFGTAQQRNDHWMNWQWDNTATYNILSGDHNLTALAGFSMQHNGWDYNQLDATGFATDDFSYKYVGGAYLKDKFQLASDFQANAMMSYVGRLNYSYNEKYFATLTAREDGTSRFGPGHKWGLFPSLALGWNIAEENFFQNLNLSFVNIVKLRAGYGKAGNQNLTNIDNVSINYPYKSLYYPSYSNGSVSYISDGRLGNPNLSWEKQSQTNLGLDLGFLSNRLNVTLDYFDIVNDNLLLQRDLSTTASFSNTIVNGGTLTNKGVELSVNAKIINQGNFRWSVSANASSARNRITKLYGDVQAIYKKGGYTGQEIQREGNYFLNESINSIYVYKFDKIAQEGDMDHVAQMNLGGRIVKPGDILPKDINGDNIIDNKDRYVVGRKDPKFYGGFSTDLGWKNFSVNAVFSFNYGAKRISSLYESMMYGNGLTAAHKDLLNRWTPEHTDTNVPRAYSAAGRYNISDVDLGVQNASFLRMSALTVAYTLPSAILSKAKVNNLRIYFTGSNMFIITKYKGYDPEGGDSYPTSKQFITGINLSF